VVGSLQNKDNFLVTNVHEDFSMDVPTPNMISSSSPSLANASHGVAITYAWIVGFNHSKTIIKRGMISFTSYSATRQITFPCTT
jgi:hypothetical protein